MENTKGELKRILDVIGQVFLIIFISAVAISVAIWAIVVDSRIGRPALALLYALLVLLALVTYIVLNFVPESKDWQPGKKIRADRMALTGFAFGVLCVIVVGGILYVDNDYNNHMCYNTATKSYVRHTPGAASRPNVVCWPDPRFKHAVFK